jgi:hypothetical protein
MILSRTGVARDRAAAALHAVGQSITIPPGHDGLRALRVQGRADLAILLDRYWVLALRDGGSAFRTQIRAATVLEGPLRALAEHAIRTDAARDYLGFVLAVESIALIGHAGHEPLLAGLATLIDAAGRDGDDARQIEAYAFFVLHYIETLGKAQALLPVAKRPRLRSVI